MKVKMRKIKPLMRLYIKQMQKKYNIKILDVFWDKQGKKNLMKMYEFSKKKDVFEGVNYVRISRYKIR